MNMATSPSNRAALTPFDRKLEYQSALLNVLRIAQRELILCERDYCESDIDSRACHDALWAFFTAPSPGRLKILVQNADFLATRCPRLLQLRDRFSHLIEIRQVTTFSYGQEKGFVIADRQLFMQRHHFSSFRGETGENPHVVANLQHDFALLWEQASPADSLQRLYL
ncbi:hypothetical protein HQN60_15280 [Deefgea piscis]|uniref:DUF7931 domain-containing protein n=1 Tax=Deefgea piscis TaxID=2739061 RepID=A0A6M8SRJ4_9NEIS|nr:hypothetical protein [Deefgea piscis]QKJ67973.1 hypothetical protein HQN60_15280 [Deefgea piscis]